MHGGLFVHPNYWQISQGLAVSSLMYEQAAVENLSIRRSLCVFRRVQCFVSNLLQILAQIHGHSRFDARATGKTLVL